MRISNWFGETIAMSWRVSFNTECAEGTEKTEKRRTTKELGEETPRSEIRVGGNGPG
jgi:hypothetical protein